MLNRKTLLKLCILQFHKVPEEVANETGQIFYNIAFCKDKKPPRYGVVWNEGYCCHEQ